MRYRDMLRETIVTRPRNMERFLVTRLSALATIRARLAHANDLIKQNTEGESTLNYCVRSGAPDDQKEAARDISRLEYLNLDRDYQLEGLETNLESYRKYRSTPGYDFMKYVFSTLDYVRPIDAETRAVIPLLAYAEAGFAEYGYREGNPEDEADPDYQAAKKLLAAYRIIAGCLPQIESLQLDIKSKLSAVRDLMQSYEPDKYQPAHSDTETLYHATAYITEIVRDGFQAEPPDGRRGLGNFGHQNDISFTHDLEIARNIMRMLKEMWMIAHGQLTGNTIMKWAQAEGIADELRKSWSGLTSRPGPWSRDAKPEDVAYLYRYWLAHTKLRVDPGMTFPDRIIAMLQDRTLPDIGVLACEVRIQPEDRYLWAESEFRVTADRVLSTKRLF